MKGFTDLLKSNFGDSATPLTPPLEPRLKPGQIDAAGPPLPEFFHMRVGELRVPRQTDPKKPNYDMIKDARKGVLSGFLRSGKIFRASDFVGMVNPKTANITLHGIYDFQTRYLNTTDNQPIPQLPLSSIVSFKKVADEEVDDEKSLRNLFYVALAHDELPSFHFWTKAGDLDPVTIGKPMDWGKHFAKNPPSPTTAAKISMLENKRKENVQRGAEEQQSTQNEQPLGFLDHYNDNTLPDSGRESTQEHPADGQDLIPQISVARDLAQSPLESEVLLHASKGGMYLREFTLKALYDMARWLVANEEDEGGDEDEAKEDQVEDREMILDILGPGKKVCEEKVASVSRATNRAFLAKIKPYLGLPGYHFRIRSTRFESSWNLNSDFDAGGVGYQKYDLKLVRPNVGHCYCSAMWHITENEHLNSLEFDKALRFLFDWELSAYPNSAHLILDVPGHGTFDLDRDSDLVVDTTVQKVFAEISSTPVRPDSHPIEVFIHDVVEDVTDLSDHPVGEVPDMLKETETPQPPLLSNSEITKLQERLKIAEASNIETDDLQERLKIAEDKLSEMDILQQRLRNSEDRAKLKSSCPFCTQDWAGATRQQQQDHLKLHQNDIVYQPAPQECPQPDCTVLLGEGHEDSSYEAISAHLRSHIEIEHAEDGICAHQGCHANMYALTAEQQEEHESTHPENQKTEDERDRMQEQTGNVEEIVKERDQLQEQVNDLEKMADERDRLQQHVGQLQDAANERDQLREDLVTITEERYELQERHDRLEMRLMALQDSDEEIETEESESETEMREESKSEENKSEENKSEENKSEESKQPRRPEAPKKLRYCNVCLKSVDKLSANAKEKHADKCETSVSEFLLLTPAEAKGEREKRNDSRDVVRPQAQEGTEEQAEVPYTRLKKKQKAATSDSQPDEAEEDADTVQQPEASKATGRKTSKRKFDTFKPAKEDESDGDVGSPKKKPKVKAKPAKASVKETTPTRKSARVASGKDVSEAPEDGNEEEVGEAAHDEPSSSAQRGKRKKKAAAVTAASKKAKTKG